MFTRGTITKWIIFPLVIGSLLYSALLFIAFRQFSAMLERLLPAEGAWYTTPLSYLLVCLAGLGIVILGAFCYTAVGRIILIPFAEKICASTEAVLGVSDIPEQSFRDTVKDIPRLLRVESVKLFFALVIIATTFFFSFLLPPVAVILTPLTCWYIAFESVDYSHERRKRIFRERLRWGLKYWLPLVCFGGLLLLLTGIPVVGIIALPAGVVGGTMLYHDLNRENGAVRAI